MKLREALDIINNRSRAGGDTFTCAIATGFNPVHLVTFLGAELRTQLPDNNIKIEQGFYGDFLGNVERLSRADAEVGIIVMEWGDLDPRLGIRSTAAWSPSTRADIVARVKSVVAQLEQTVAETSQRMPLVLCAPTLPLLPLSHAPCWQASSFELELRSAVDSALLRVVQLAQVRILNSQQIHSVSPFGERFDIESELRTGFPYRLPHASAFANLLARLTQNARAKKGLITDLDDTLWRGILGEVGVDGISWDLDNHSQMHALYQRFLGCLCSEGVLIAVTSKNDPSLVEQAFGRKDLALVPTELFPIEANWGAKSEAVSRILNVWNISAAAVVFVDDSPLELAEVKAAHPEIECVQFPTNDNGAIYEMIVSLRERFGKSTLLPEDELRGESIRRSSLAGIAGDWPKRTSKDFLLQMQAEITFNFDLSPLDPRVLDLVNKTNQFNLNGTRYTEAAWQKYFRKPGTLLLVTSYTDKFGPLGKIAVVAGYQAGKRLCIDTWVMSCRAFSRRIEYRCLEELFLRFGIEEIQFNFIATERNKPFQMFLEKIVGTGASLEHVLERSAYFSARYREAEEVAL